MTAKDIIDKTDELVPNQYDTETKLSWLGQLDGKIYNDLLMLHEGQTATKPTETYTETTVLLVPHPYGKQMYLYYLAAQIAAMNTETTKFNQFITLFNSEYQEYSNHVIRNSMPKEPTGGSRWSF